MTSREEQSKQIRQKRTEQIMFSALKLFAHRGLVGTKSSMIAKEAGLSEGLIYKYFETKNELFIRLVKWAIEEAANAMKQVYDLPGSPIEKLRTISEEILDKENQLGFLLMHQAMTGEGIPTEAKELIRQHGSVVHYVNILEPLFIEGQKAGDFVQGNPRELASAYLKVLSGLMTIQIDENDEFPLPSVDFIMRMFANPNSPKYR